MAIQAEVQPLRVTGRTAGTMFDEPTVTGGERPRLSVPPNLRRRRMKRVLGPMRQPLRRLIGSSVAGQGAHIDPLSAPPPDQSDWSREMLAAAAGAEMDRYRDGLRPGAGGSVRDGVLEDLSAFYEMTPDDCVRRAIDWEAWSVQEWSASERESAEGLREFMRTTRSWSFDLLWYAYQQAEGYGRPDSPAVARFLRRRGVTKGRYLDFGSGVGATAQLFAALGYDTTLADVSDTLLDFARFRLERRGVAASYLNLNQDALPVGTYHAITALDVMAHVPDLPETLAALWRSLVPGGWLFATLDARVKAPESAWHLYDEEWDMCWQLERAGFAQRAMIGPIRCYQRVEPHTVAARWNLVRGALCHRNPLLLALRRAVRAIEQRGR
jgi:SAM-dependent methyltransferase